MNIANGHVVTMHYTLKNERGEVLDSSEGQDPLAYLHGAGNIVPGLEAQLAGKAVGSKLDAVVAPVDGYGEKTGPGPQPVSRSQFPRGMEIEEGMVFTAEDENGDQTPVWISAVEGDMVMVDRDHPLAGVTLHFSVEVVAIRDATTEELAHGHPHGPDGHDHHH